MAVAGMPLLHALVLSRAVGLMSRSEDYLQPSLAEVTQALGHKVQVQEHGNTMKLKHIIKKRSMWKLSCGGHCHLSQLLLGEWNL